MKQVALFASRAGVAVKAAACALVLCSAVTGCGSSDRLKKQVSELETQLTAVRADQDRLEERLAAVELSASVPRSAPPPPTDRVEHSRLKVIHLEPEGPDSTAEPAEPSSTTAPDSTAHRPVIRGTGDRVIKVGDEDSPDESKVDPATRPVANLGKEARGN